MRIWLGILAAVGLVLLLKPTPRVTPPAAPVPSPSRQAAPAPEPVRFKIGTVDHGIRLDALIAYGATPRDALCAEPAKPEAKDGDGIDDLMTGIVCGRGGAPPALPLSEGALIEASMRLSGLAELPRAEQEQRIRDANGFVLLALRGGVFETAPMLPAESYSGFAEQASDGRVHEIASELWLVQAALCEAQDRSCRVDAERQAAVDLVDAGRWFNDSERLERAGALVETTLRRDGGKISAQDRFDLQNIVGNAYSYASTFGRDAQRIPLIQRAIASYEQTLPYADARAPSFDTARAWQNLGAAYGDRGALTGSKQDFQLSVSFYEKSLPLFDRRNDRQAWARSKSNMGAARSEIATADGDLALHDAGIADLEGSIAAFDEGGEQLDAAHSRYRQAKALAAKAETALALAKRSETDTRERDRLTAVARTALDEAQIRSDRAAATFRQSGSKDYLASTARVARKVATLRQSLQP